MDSSPLYSLVLPCYNEAAVLPEMIPPLLEALTESRLDFELVLVDNGSRDDTGKVIDRLAAHPRVRKAVVERNEGYGLGILAGLRHSRSPYVAYMCSDGQISPGDVVNTLRAIQREGSGTLVKVLRLQREDGSVRRFISQIYNSLFTLLFGHLSDDVNGTPKVLHRSDLERIDPRQRDWFIDAEVMIRARRLGLRVVEVPVVFHRRARGRSNVGLATLLEFIRNMIRFRLKSLP